MSFEAIYTSYAASASPLCCEALYFFRVVSALREGHRAQLTVQEHRWLRWEVEGNAFLTDSPAILRRCQAALAADRALRLARIDARRGYAARTDHCLPGQSCGAVVIPFRPRQAPCAAPQYAVEA